MKNPPPLLLLLCALGIALSGCSKSPPTVTLVPAPPGPSDLGPAIECGSPPAGAVVFDLHYLAQTGTGAAEDIQYHSYWGYGRPVEEAKTDTFLQDVRHRVSGLYEVQNPNLPGRKWAAVEYSDRKALALYFDLNADGKLANNERILPSRSEGDSTEFITADFMQRPVTGSDGGQMLCRVLLRVNFYGGSEPNCMWSPAALMEGTATLNGKAARLLLFQNSPGGTFNQYGSSSYSLLVDAAEGKTGPQGHVPGYVPRETLSSVIASDGVFYRLTVDGRRTNGLPARVVLVEDTSPTGELEVQLTGSESLQARLNTLSLQGVDDKTVFFRVSSSRPKFTLPVGTYALNSGQAVYGTLDPPDWEVSFSRGPNAGIKAGATTQVALGAPTLTIRAVEENRRYDRDAVQLTTFKQSTRIYLEPTVLGKSGEVFSRFRKNPRGARATDRPPQVTITGPDGKQLVSRTMEYG